MTSIVLAPQQAALAGVRVEPGHASRGRVDAEVRQLAARSAAACRGSGSRVSRRGTSRSGTCTVASTTRSVGEWNIIATLRHAAQVRQQIGVALPAEAGGRKRHLVDRRRGDALHDALPRIVDRAHDGVEGGAAGLRR